MLRGRLDFFSGICICVGVIFVLRFCVVFIISTFQHSKGVTLPKFGSILPRNVKSMVCGCIGEVGLERERRCMRRRAGDNIHIIYM